MLARSLAARGWPVAVVPPSRFAVDDPAHALCVVSQGLSPNARLALDGATGPTLLITAADADHGTVLRHGPAAENNMLVRVVGPVLATLAALRFAGLVDERALDAVPQRSAVAHCDVPEARFDRLAIITAGDYCDLAHGFRWKLLETLGFGDPPVYDVLQFAHGPFQQLYHERVLLIVLDRGTPREQPLFARLREMVVPERHTTLRLTATLPAPLCWFEHDALLNHVVLELLRRHPRDLINWPGKGRDQSLYGLGANEGSSTSTASLSTSTISGATTEGRRR